MEKEFELTNHTADIGIIAYGTDIKEAFINAAKGLFSLITELDDIKEVTHRDIILTSSDEESLLVEWLNELIYFFDADNIIFKRFEINQINQTQLKARAYGEEVDNSKHAIKRGVKAATYHMLKIEHNNTVKIQVLFDI
jgi:SHS2 domain-containing protein